MVLVSFGAPDAQAIMVSGCALLPLRRRPGHRRAPSVFERSTLWTAGLNSRVENVPRSNQNQINVGPIGAYEKGSNLALLLSPPPRRASTHRLLRNLALQIHPKRSTLSSCTTMTGPVRTAAEKRPPRPPNAWIIYRSAKVREMSSENPGQPRKVQADVSREISERWRTESPEVKAHYERLADEKKAEHQLLFPNYRFQPMKKEEKEKLKEEKRLEKERERAQSKKGRGRQQPYPERPLPVPMHALPAQVPAMGAYNPNGPSPPLSIASSSQDLPSSSGQQVNHGQQIPPSTNASIPDPSSVVASNNPAMYVPTTAMSFVPLFPQLGLPPQVPIYSPVPQLPTPAPSRWDLSRTWQPVQTASAVPSPWPEFANITTQGVFEPQVYFANAYNPSLMAHTAFKGFPVVQRADIGPAGSNRLGAGSVGVGHAVRGYYPGHLVVHQRSVGLPAFTNGRGRPLESPARGD